MSYEGNGIQPRNLGRPPTGRIILVFALFLAIGTFYWFALPLLQLLTIPRTVGGIDGPWVLRPIVAFHFFAAATLTIVTLPAAITPLKRRWNRADAEQNVEYDQFRGREVARLVLIIKGLFFGLIYAAGLILYLFSWTSIGPDGIEEHLPWGVRKQSFGQIAAISAIPEGERSEALRKEGPWFELRFQNGSYLTLSNDHEGCTPAELQVITAYIAARSGIRIERRKDLRPAKAKCTDSFLTHQFAKAD